MTVKIISDSLGDVPSEVAKELDITIIPVNVNFGTESYRDGIDLTTEQFYQKLTQSKILPTTAVPHPHVFAEVYEKSEGNEIVVITTSHKFSAAYKTAVQAATLSKSKDRIEVIDSLSGAMGDGLIVIAAAKAAKAGANLDEVVKLTKRNIPRSEIRMAFDTLEYLKRGGRIGRAQALVGSMLRINPVLGIKDGEAYPFARERSRGRAIDYLYQFAISFSHIDEMAVEDATTPQDAEKLVERLSAKFPKERIYRSKVSPVVGAHVGPRVLSVAVLGDR
jgi:DegV family protein with EDD domain